MALDLNNALRMGQFVNAAYLPSAAIPTTYTIPCGYQLVQPIYGNDLATDIGKFKSIVPFGFIARSPAPAADFVVAIRGTQSIWEWMQDARFSHIPCPFATDAGETEDGFTDVYASMCAGVPTGPTLKETLRTLLSATPGATLSITGHSLGSSLATLLALDIVENKVFPNPSVITFASPLVGDAQFARTYDTEVPNTWRITNVVDVVPKLPPSNWGYVHVNQLYSVSSLGKTKILPSCTHAMTTYLYLVDQANGGGGGFALDPGCAGLF